MRDMLLSACALNRGETSKRVAVREKDLPPMVRPTLDMIHESP